MVASIFYKDEPKFKSLQGFSNRPFFLFNIILQLSVMVTNENKKSPSNKGFSFNPYKIGSANRNGVFTIFLTLKILLLGFCFNPWQIIKNQPGNQGHKEGGKSIIGGAK